MASTSTLQFAGITHVGKVRDHNEDALLLLPEHGVAVVADGMGGLSRGEVASRMIVDGVRDALAHAQDVAQGILEAHARIRRASQASEHERMGSTVVAVRMRAGEALIHWVGDSRAYLLRGDQLRLLTRDHSFVNELVSVGAITAAEAETHPNRHVLTRAVGIRDTADLKIDQVRATLKRGDCLLLCSDGLYGPLPPAAMIAALQSAADAQGKADALLRAVLDHSQAEDNLTAACIIVGA